MFIGILLEFIRPKFKSNKINEALGKIDWLELYQRILKEYFKNNEIDIYKMDIFSHEQGQLEEIDEDETNKIYVKYKNENLEFVIFQNFFVTGTVTAYYAAVEVDEFLIIQRDDLIFDNVTYLKRNNSFINPNHSLTESIIFDKHFKFSGNNKAEWFKIFTPQIIEKFEKTNFNRKFDTLKLDRKGIKVKFMWTRKTHYFDTSILIFRNYFSYRTFKYGIAKSVVLDLKRFLDILSFAEPFL